MRHPLRAISSLLNRWEKQPRLAWTLSLLWVLLLSGIAFWWQLGSTGLVDETEPLFAEAARQMAVTGDWITPYFDGQPRFDKPPLVYWLMALAYQTVGVNSWAVRFPSALAATLLTAFGFYLLRSVGESPLAGDRSAAAPATPSAQRWLAAWIGAALLALTPQTIAWARIGVSDMLLSGCMGGALIAFFLGYAQPDRPRQQGRWYLAFYVLSALAVLTKGPVGIVLPGLIVIGFGLYMGNLRTVLREMRLWRGSLLFLAIALPWYALVIQANGEAFIDSFFGYHNLERFTRVVNNHSAPLLFYFGVVPVAFAPWSIYLPVAIGRLRFWKPQLWRQQPRSSHLAVFALVWLAVILGFFTVAATKLPSYMIPLLPAAAILVALFWSEQMTRSRSGRAAQLSYWVNIALLLLLAAAILYSPNWLGNEPEMPDLPQAMRASGLVLWGAGIWFVAALLGLGLLRWRQGHWLWSVNLIGCLLFLLLTVQPLMRLIDAQRQLPLRQLAATILQVQSPGEPILMVGRKPSLVFYTQRPVTFIAAPSAVRRRLERIADRLSAPDAPVHSLLILGRPPKLEEAGVTPGPAQPIAEAGVYRLLRLEFPPRTAPSLP